MAGVLSRHQLRNAMDGGGAESYDRSIDMLVARLRRKVEPDPTKPQFILTVPGVGYKFIPHVRCGQPATGAPPASRDTGQVPGAGEVPRSERRQVTVLSCQIIGFAALAAKLDPEDLDRAIGPVYAACAAVIYPFQRHRRAHAWRQHALLFRVPEGARRRCDEGRARRARNLARDS